MAESLLRADAGLRFPHSVHDGTLPHKVRLGHGRNADKSTVSRSAPLRPSWRLGLAALLAALVLAGTCQAADETRVTFPSNDADLTHGAPTRLNGLVFRPNGAGPFPAMVLLHGCGGLRKGGTALPLRERDWMERFTAAGYLTLFVDSFTPRGLREVCTLRKQTVRPAPERNRDVYGALRFLQARQDVFPGRIGLMGWSHGGSTTLATVNQATAARPRDLPLGDFRAAVAFYPGCSSAERDTKWGTAIPLFILIGEADDWTPAAPCQALAARMREAQVPLELAVYPGAYHGFDAPDTPVHVRRGVNLAHGGSAHLGTDPAGREDAIRRVTAFLAGRLKP